MPRLRTINELRRLPPVILPSLLLCDFTRLGEEVLAVEKGGARALHLDMMDGHFVPNLTYGMPIIEAVRRVTDLPIDVHMMVSNPGDFIDEVIRAGADIVTIHAEAVDDPRPVLEQIRRLDACASLAINPPTSVETIAESLPLCDMVLCMSVVPGFGAQAFEPVALEKLRALKQQRGDSLLLEIDGGVNATTISDCTRAGAQLLVVGSAIFKKPVTYAESLSDLTQLASEGLS